MNLLVEVGHRGCGRTGPGVIDLDDRYDRDFLEEWREAQELSCVDHPVGVRPSELRSVDDKSPLWCRRPTAQREVERSSFLAQPLA